VNEPAERGFAVDRATQAWVRVTGQRVEFDEYPWLRGPIGNPRVIADHWLDDEAARVDGQVEEGGGLVSSMGVLRGVGFDPDFLAPPVVDFYERTTDWRMDVWSQWCPAAWPFGWLLSTVFARRLEQLSLPLRPLDVAQGVDSRVRSVVDAEGVQRGAAWLRTLRSNGSTVYSGWYGTATLPENSRPSVSVAFPLPNGRVTVYLRPDVRGGELRLTSPIGAFGGDGAYLILSDADGEAGWVRRVPLAEQFRIYVDAEGVLRTDHALDLWNIPVIRLHYRLEPRQQPARS
jgi:hypothetical protein